MSLRNRILILFGIFAILPLLALAAFSYWQTRTLLDEAVRGQLTELARAVSEDLENSLSEFQADLDALVEAVVEDGRTVSLSDSILHDATYVRVRNPDGTGRLMAGSIPAELVRCESGWKSELVSFASSGAALNSGVVVEAGVWASDLLSLSGARANHSVRVLGPSGTWILASAECPPQASLSEIPNSEMLEKISTIPDGDGTFRFEEGGDAMVGAVASLGKPGWVVFSSSSETEVLGPVRRLIFSYFLVVLALAGSTGIAFSIMVRRYTLSLSELARAAEEIGLGEMDPWLPLPSADEVGQLTTAFSRMLARIRKMMDQVNQSGRLAVVGQLSAYLAHEIRNPMSSIKLNLQRLLRWTQTGRLPAYCREPLEISLKEVERLNASVTGVLQLSRANESPREVLGLHRLLEEAADLVSARFRRQGVGLLLDLDAEADLVLARAGQLKSAALNLMVNALEAQERGGSLEIRTSLGRMPDQPGPCVFLHFRDQGPGIPADIRDRIFEPFFTTKAGGAGIGLAMAKQAVDENGGELFLAASFSNEKGAEFVAVFPLAAAQESGTEGDRPDQNSLDEQYSLSSSAYSASRRKRDPGSFHPSHLLTPGGLAVVMPSPTPDAEEES